MVVVVDLEVLAEMVRGYGGGDRRRRRLPKEFDERNLRRKIFPLWFVHNSMMESIRVS